MPAATFEDALAADAVSESRRAAYRRFLRDLQSWLAPRPLTEVTADDLDRYLDSKLAEGFHPNTVRNWRNLARRYFGWAYHRGDLPAETLLAIRGVQAPRGSSSRTAPRPYARKELEALRGTLEERWPLLPPDEATRYVRRWLAGRGRYSRVRRHAIRLQLEAVIALALHAGLRRRELVAMHIDDLSDENAYIVVWEGDRWGSDARPVPFTDEGRQRIGCWLAFRAELQPEHSSPWLNLWCDRTAREPMSPETLEKLLPTYLGKGWTLSRLRHTCGVTWLQAGLSVWELQRLLGHRSPADTFPYAQAVRIDLERRVDRLSATFSNELTALGRPPARRVAADDGPSTRSA
jgi:site-specific recombinase XerD